MIRENSEKAFLCAVTVSFYGEADHRLFVRTLFALLLMPMPTEAKGLRWLRLAARSIALYYQSIFFKIFKQLE